MTTRRLPALALAVALCATLPACGVVEKVRPDATIPAGSAPATSAPATSAPATSTPAGSASTTSDPAASGTATPTEAAAPETTSPTEPDPALTSDVAPDPTQPDATPTETSDAGLAPTPTSSATLDVAIVGDGPMPRVIGDFTPIPYGYTPVRASYASPAHRAFSLKLTPDTVEEGMSAMQEGSTVRALAGVCGVANDTEAVLCYLRREKGTVFMNAVAGELTVSEAVTVMNRYATILGTR